MHRMSAIRDRPLTFVINGRHVVAPLLPGATWDEAAMLRYPVSADAFVRAAFWKGESVLIFLLAQYLRDPLAWWRTMTPELREAEAMRDESEQDALDADAVAAIANLTAEVARRACVAAEEDFRNAAAVKADLDAIVRAFEAARAGKAPCPCCETLILDLSHIDRQLAPILSLALDADVAWKSAFGAYVDAKRDRDNAECAARTAADRLFDAQRRFENALDHLAVWRSDLESRSLLEALERAKTFAKSRTIVVDARGAGIDLDLIAYPCIIDQED